MGCGCIKSKQSKKSKKSKNEHSQEGEFRPLGESANENEIIIPDEPQAGSENFLEFFSTSSKIGLWSYSQDTSDVEFEEALNEHIESEYLTGKSFTEVTLDNNLHKIIFAESVMYKDDQVIPVNRLSLVQINYGWKADDKTVRPFIKEVADTLEESGGLIKCKIDDTPYKIDLPGRRMIDLNTQVKRKIILL